MNKNPLVSVIIPAYNVEQYIKEAINSVLLQTHSNTEIIVVDDGSTDGTKKALEDYIKKNQIVYLYQDNKGLSGARNAGIQIAKGEFIALLDADDMFVSDKIEKQVLFMKNNQDCNFCYCDVSFFVDGKLGKTLKSHFTYYSGNVFKHLLEGNFINPSTLFFRKQTFEKFGTFDESFKKGAEDLEYYLRASLQGAKFCFINEPLFQSRIRKSGNLQSDQVLTQSSVLRVFENLKLKLSPEDSEKYHLNKVIKKRKFKLALAYLIEGEKKSCRNILNEMPMLNAYRTAIYLLSILPKFISKIFINKLILVKRNFLYR